MVALLHFCSLKNGNPFFLHFKGERVITVSRAAILDGTVSYLPDENI